MIEWLHAAGYRKREIQNLVEDHLKSVILRNFDTTKADLIFTEEASILQGPNYMGHSREMKKKIIIF